MASSSVIPFDPLTAITPLDGRYHQDTQILAPFVSELALIRTRFEIEGHYLVALSDYKIIRKLTKKERQILTSVGDSLTFEQALEVKKIEEETRHDVKAVERLFRKLVKGTSLEDVVEMIHFGLTSEDINNLAYRLIFKRATHEVIIPAAQNIVTELVTQADQYKSLPMLARTHGQAAIPTTLGKELVNFAIRLHTQIKKLHKLELMGKLNGAVGNYNALHLAAPHINWITFSKDFVALLGLTPNILTTQINPHEDMIETFQTFVRINGVLLDLNQDMWRYISDGWFIQQIKKGEVGSSVMPQKVNPISFENSEGNIHMANSLFEGMSRQLAVSRLQRDLSGSTTIRNIGSAVAYSLISYQNSLRGLKRVRPDTEKITAALNENWTILSEGVQTVLRRAGVNDPYSLLASLTKGQNIGVEEWGKMIESLPVSAVVKKQLITLTPKTYIGNAVKLTEMAIKEIKKNL